MAMVWTFVLGQPRAAGGAEVRVAVAANFVDCLERIVPGFEESTGHTVTPISGSTGRLYAQIRQGAPFDVFLAADKQRPLRLFREGLADEARIYAQGRLVLWFAPGGLTASESLQNVLLDARTEHIALANPELAPYGRAAQQALFGLGLEFRVKDRLVMGTSVGQTWQFAISGNVQAALLALSQVRDEAPDRYLVVPRGLHDTIDHMAVRPAHSPNPEAARQFLDYLVGPAAAAIIIESGYTIPEGAP